MKQSSTFLELLIALVLATSIVAFLSTLTSMSLFSHITTKKQTLALKEECVCFDILDYHISKATSLTTESSTELKWERLDYPHIVFDLVLKGKDILIKESNDTAISYTHLLDNVHSLNIIKRSDASLTIKGIRNGKDYSFTLLLPADIRGIHQL